MTPEFWIVAGPNGAGKTTLVSKGPISQLLSHVVYWNPDDLARQILIERGFAEVDISRLPEEKQSLYNYERRSKIFMKGL